MQKPPWTEREVLPLHETGTKDPGILLEKKTEEMKGGQPRWICPEEVWERT